MTGRLLSKTFLTNVFLQARRLSGLFDNFKKILVHEQFGVNENREVTIVEFRDRILDVVINEIVPSIKTNVQPVTTERNMDESYCRLQIPVNGRGYQLRYLSANRAGIRLGRLLEDLDMFSVWLSYLHCQGRENWGKPTVNPCIFVTACCDQINLATQDINPKSDLHLEGHVSWAGGASVETTMRIVQDEKQLLDAKFIMVNLSPQNMKEKVNVPQLIHESPVENELFKLGQKNNARRKSQKDESFLKRPPTPDQVQQLHQLHLRRVKDMSYVPSDGGTKDTTYIGETARMTTVNCFPEDQNFYGKMFGGFLMRQAYELAAINSKLFARTRTECIAMDDIVFAEPVEIGDILELWTRITCTQDQFMQTRVFARKVIIDDDKSIRYQTSNTFHFSFMTLDGSKVRTVLPKDYFDGLLYHIGKKHLLECRRRTGL
ncbi:unnamed protein product [Bursaphelenchus okinawaensis]|uniref:HotDog ACOT-type domain-containing protein n=1 Tax=Bursaphelenchus okinawaensis TaxID=465554 RepID=A0A811LM67_9BILA|nr:unnamed protein product [Bursaphelenchus okinawaensis]CAG9126494.1 unnamed protein product [Bursaphelenchus okinawaensis]